MQGHSCLFCASYSRKCLVAGPQTFPALSCVQVLLGTPANIQGDSLLTHLPSGAHVHLSNFFASKGSALAELRGGSVEVNGRLSAGPQHTRSKERRRQFLALFVELPLQALPSSQFWGQSAFLLAKERVFLD